jgi:hypothetical protein
MINTTDFLNALRLFEQSTKLDDLLIELKIKVRAILLDELEKLKDQINEVDLGDETPELFEGVNNALKNL